jgi:hypothetical protein
MKAEIKKLHSPDIEDLENYKPDAKDDFCFLIQIIAGPEGEDGEESFDVIVCTPKWLLANSKEGAIDGQHYLITSEYNYEALLAFIKNKIESLESETWQGIAEQFAKFGKWEFENYKS